ncbi:hypothetical protein SAM19_05148 [Brevibacillus laterosporus]|nr:hypothetical protein [Brevibacillus laterosporus]
MMICTPYIVKNGKVIYPKNSKHFCFEVTEEQHQNYLLKKEKRKKKNK